MNEKDSLQQWWNRIPVQMKAAFFSCVILGFLIHLFAFTNIIPNADGLNRIFDEQQMTISGRWFLHYASMFHGFLQAPGLIGLLSLLFLGLAAGMVVDVLKIRSLLSAVFCGVIMALFPSVAYTYLYMFTASAYSFAICIAVLSVWITRKYPKFFPAASLVLACSVGTYQAYFAVAAALALSCVILDLLDYDTPVDQTVRKGFLLLGMLALGAVLYYGILQVFLFVKDLELLSYLGMDEFGAGLSVIGLLREILSVYKQFLYFFLIPGSLGYNTLPLVLAHIVLYGVAGFSAMMLLLRQQASVDNAHTHTGEGRLIRIVLMGVGCLLMPLACNFSQLLSDPTPLMRYGFVMTYILLIAIAEKLSFRAQRGTKMLKSVFAAAMATTFLIFAQTCNMVYTVSETAHRATLAFSTNLVGRVEATPGYEQGMEVVIVGAFPDEVYYNQIEAFDMVKHYSCTSASMMHLNKHTYQYLNHWLNVPWEEPSEEVFLSVSESDFFQSMPLYPSDGSIRIQDGRVIVRIAETYTPKKPYEIAYENRR